MYSKENSKVHNRKKYRIKSPVRFITFLVIVIGITVGAFGMISGLYTATALDKQIRDHIVIEVAAGDTVWDIAYEYKSTDTDTREAVYEICKENQIKDGHIEEGMKLSIPMNL